MRKLVLIFLSLSILVACQDPKDFSSYDKEEAIAFAKPMFQLHSLKSVKKLQESKSFLEETKYKYCSIVPEDLVKVIIAQELVFGDTTLNDIVSTGETILINPISNKLISSIVKLHKIDPEPFNKIADKLTQGPISKEMSINKGKIRSLFKGNIKEQDIQKTVELLGASICGISSLYLSLIGEKNDIVDELSKAILSEYLSISIELETKDINKSYKDIQDLLKNFQ